MTDLYTDNRAVRHAREKVLNECSRKRFSDIVDGEGNQYVDFVMEGGGVLGIALVGFTYMLEQAGIRFLGLGGTSAGSINALVLAAIDVPAAAKSKKLIEVLADIPMSSFIDGDSDAQDFCRAILAKRGAWKLAWKAVQVVDNFKQDLGLNPGGEFQKWLGDVLHQFNVYKISDIDRKLKTRPKDLKYFDNRPLLEADGTGRLALVTADITTETKVELPRMAMLYWDNPDEVAPEVFARASMSIPGFFYPVRRPVPLGMETQWKELALYEGEIPSEVILVDGGIMSNFPIDLFHKKDRVPALPTFGAKIGSDRKSARKIDSPGSLTSAVFDAARHTLDFDFIKRNPDYRLLVSEINTGNHNWLDFDLSQEAKIDLFSRGAACAAEFLCKFDWEAYKEVRKSLADAHLKSASLDKDLGNNAIFPDVNDH